MYVLAGAGYRSLEEAAEDSEGWGGSHRLPALLAIRFSGGRRFVPVLERAFAGPHYWEAAMALGEVGGPRALALLRGRMQSHPDPERRLAAAYGLAFSFAREFRQDLVEVLQDRQEYPEIRGQAAEGLANLLGHVDRRQAAWRRTIPVLLEAARDPSPIVRFWSVFALGKARARQAEPLLRHLVETDHATCPGWWTVGEEARDALVRIAGRGEIPDRERVGTEHPRSWEQA